MYQGLHGMESFGIIDEPDLENGCDLDYTPNVGVKHEINAAASCSLGFGGHNACIILKKYKD